MNFNELSREEVHRGLEAALNAQRYQIVIAMVLAGKDRERALNGIWEMNEKLAKFLELDPDRMRTVYGICHEGEEIERLRRMYNIDSG